MTTAANHSASPLSLTMHGYAITITDDATKQKQLLLASSASITLVTTHHESAIAQRSLRALAAMRRAVEQSRKMAKTPVMQIGQQIDLAAKNFSGEIEAEERRLALLVGAHAEHVARELKARESAERQAMAAAHEARAAAERAQAAADASGTASAIIAARQAQDERRATLAARILASDEVAATRIPNGVNFTWDFEVEDIRATLNAAPEFVTLEIKRAAVLAWLRELSAADEDVAARGAMIGIRAHLRPVVVTR